MIKCQKRERNLFYFFLLGFLMVCFSGYCDSNNFSLQRADSLFNAKKYTESFQLYEELDSRGVSTSAMYLKMAYIKEALNDVSGTLYYLNKYYLSTFNSTALKKMEKLSEEHQLSGYDYNDLDFFRNLLLNYSAVINYVFIFVLLLLFIFILVKVRNTNVIPQTAFAFFVALLIIFLINYNFHVDNSIGIVNRDNIFLMDGPSAASQPVQFIKQGHRVSVAGEQGPWLEVNWEGSKAFIKKNNVSLIEKKESLILWTLSKIKETIQKPS